MASWHSEVSVCFCNQRLLRNTPFEVYALFLTFFPQRKAKCGQAIFAFMYGDTTVLPKAPHTSPKGHIEPSGCDYSANIPSKYTPEASLAEQSRTCCATNMSSKYRSKWRLTQDSHHQSLLMCRGSA